MNIRFPIALLDILPQKAEQPSRNLAIETLAAHIRKCYSTHVQVRLWDLQYQTFEDVVDEVLHFSPKLVGFSMPIGTVNVGKEMLAALRAGGLHADVLIGSLVATNAPRELAETFPDSLLVLGEGEWPLEKIVGYYLDDQPELAKTVASVAYYDATTRQYHRTPPVKKVIFGGFAEDLWDKVIAHQGQMLIEGSRGCLAACTFCSSRNLHSYGWVPRPVGDVLQEIRAIYARGVRWIFFVDDDFVGTSWEHAMELGQQIGEQFPGLKYGISVRADSLIKPEARENLRILNHNGLTQVLMGLESGSAKQLARFAKRANPAINATAIKVLNSVPGLSYSLGFLIDPLISRSELLETIEFVLDHNICTKVNHPFGTLDVHKGSRFEILTRQAYVQESFDLNSLTWKCHYRDLEVAQIMQSIKDIEKCLAPAEKQLTTEYRAITRIPIPDPGADLLRQALEHDMGVIKVLQFKLGHYLTQNLEKHDYPQDIFQEQFNWTLSLERQYKTQLPALSQTAAQSRHNLMAYQEVMGGSCV